MAQQWHDLVRAAWWAQVHTAGTGKAVGPRSAAQAGSQHIVHIPGSPAALAVPEEKSLGNSNPSLQVHKDLEQTPRRKNNQTWGKHI